MCIESVEMKKRHCIQCEKCVKWCVQDAIKIDEYPIIDFDKCNECGVCMRVCPKDVIEVKDSKPNQKIYEEFAEIYESGEYAKLSKEMTEIVPEILDYYDHDVEKILDIACGEGTFAVEMAEKGYDVTGLDISLDNLKYASGKRTKEKVNFIQSDMRDLSFEEEYDIVTCLGDSLNYIIHEEELKEVFERVYQALKNDGLFIFDMNSIYMMEEVWTGPAVVDSDTEEKFVVTDLEYDEDEHITVMKFTAFLKEKSDCWKKIEEVHQERAYSHHELKGIFEGVGFDELAFWDDPKKRSDAGEESGRVWFVLQK